LSAFTPAEWGVLAIYAFLVAVSKTGVPGLGTMVVIWLLFTMPAKMSVGFMLPLLVMGDAFAVAYYRRHAVWAHVLRLMPWAVLGILAGYLLLGVVDDNQLKRVIGLIVLVLVMLETWRNARTDAPIPQKLWVAAGIGILAGIATMMANAAGPLIVLYFIAMRLEKQHFIGTAAWYFLILNLFKVPFMWSREMITWQTLRINLMLLPAVAVGAVVGIAILQRLPQKGFLLTAKVMTFGGAAWLLFGDFVVDLIRK
jgi:uncharacterized membrane protein YfcA